MIETTSIVYDRNGNRVSKEVIKQSPDKPGYDNAVASFMRYIVEKSIVKKDREAAG